MILTPRQKEILDYIVKFTESAGYSPSYREIAEHFGFTSVATVADHIDSLRQKGLLEKSFNRARSLQLTPSFMEKEFEIPLIGVIAAGHPIEAIRTNETIQIPRDMMAPNVFALKVRGQSMTGDGIQDGDYVIIKQVKEPRNGDVVVALVDNDNVTLKRFYKEKHGRVRLQPTNPKYKSTYPKNLQIQGKLVGLIRKYA